jgi:hypothetical protein
MKFLQILLVFTLLSSSAIAQDYLNPSCQSILQNDLANKIVVDDVDGDGIANILMGTKINGILYNYIYKNADCTQQWTALGSGGWQYDTKGNIKSYKVSDLDGDGKKQIVLNSMKSSHPGAQIPEKYLWVITPKGLEDWHYKESCGFAHSVDVADIDGSGAENVIFGAQSKICALKDSIKTSAPVLWSYNIKYPSQHIEAVDLTGNGRIEVIALSGKYGIGKLYALDSRGNLIWEKEIPKGLYTPMHGENLISIEDLDGDGRKEIVVGTYEAGLIAYRSDGSEYANFKTGKLISAVKAADIDGDGKAEILAGSAPNVYALDSNLNVKWKWNSPTERTI